MGDALDKISGEFKVRKEKLRKLQEENKDPFHITKFEFVYSFFKFSLFFS